MSHRARRQVNGQDAPRRHRTNLGSTSAWLGAVLAVGVSAALYIGCTQGGSRTRPAVKDAPPPPTPATKVQDEPRVEPPRVEQAETTEAPRVEVELVTSEPAAVAAEDLPAKADTTTAIQTKTHDWCVVEVPESVAAGTEIRIAIRIKGMNRKVFLCCDLKDEHHGMMKWGGPPRELSEGEQTVYTLKVDDKTGLENVYAYIMAFDDKDRTTELKHDATPLVKVTGASKPEPIGYNRSWIWIDPSNANQQLVEGDTWQVPVEYHLDETEAQGGTKLNMWVAGPWIDCPVKPYTTGRYHETYSGLSAQIDATPGTQRHVFTFTIPKAKEHNGLLIIGNFVDPAGKSWPWHVRGGGPHFVRKDGQFELDTDTPGNLFLYEQPVTVFAALKNVRRGDKKTLKYTVYDTDKAKRAEGQVSFTPREDGQKVAIPLKLNSRGTFLIEAEVDGWEKRHTTFCRIPDVLAVTGGGKTKFGLTSAGKPSEKRILEERCKVAQMLGLTVSREWFGWRDIEPGPGVFKLDDWSESLKVAKKHGIDPWLCIISPPAWALEESAKDVGYSGFKCKLDEWEKCVRVVSKRFKGTIYGWEWLNEIVPGGAATAVEDYVGLCRAGTATAKGVDAELVTMMAGGLWPRSFRKELLTAGLGKYVDVLPVHYSDSGGVLEARADLDAVGATKVEVWDDETARGVSTWNMPPIEQVAIKEQSRWVMTQWPDELIADCKRIIYFGGDGDAAGNWTYMLDDHSPRPVVATIAVLVSKLHGAEAVGVFSLGSGGVFHLFDRGGKAVLVAAGSQEGERVDLHAGPGTLTITDYQGNEKHVRSNGSTVALDLSGMPSFVEGGDLDILKAYCVASVQSQRETKKLSKLVPMPRITAMSGGKNAIYLKIVNHYSRALSGTFAIDLPEGWSIDGDTRFSLDPGKVESLTVPLSIPVTATPKDYAVEVAFDFAWRKLPGMKKPAMLSVISPDMLGNLFPYGDFEEGTAAPTGWDLNGTTKREAPPTDPGLGLGKRILEFRNTNNNWESVGQGIDLRGGHTYLYTAWIWNEGMQAGSNLYHTSKTGISSALYINQVFNAGNNNSWWQMYTCRYNAPEDTKHVSFTPVANGMGRAYCDNIRVTLFEGTDFAAECHPAVKAPRIDGKLDDWVTKCPIPLIGKNQLTVEQDGYAFAPKNLNAVAYTMWDADNIYIAVEVIDDVHHASSTGERTTDGDSLVLAFDPTNRSPDAVAKAFAYYISSASPGGGSGRHTVYRPPTKSGGLSSGQLAKDSSVYGIAILAERGRCTYEIRIPVAELGGITGEMGSKFALSIQLNDNDGGAVGAHMNWGGGLSPKWDPAQFGIVTLVN